MMLIDSGAPKSIVSKKWFAEYLREAKVNEDELNRFWALTHLSESRKLIHF